MKKMVTEPKLTMAQQAVLKEITSPSLPMDDELPWWVKKRHKDGTVSGAFVKSTLEALERKGYIKVYRLTKGDNFDVIRVLRRK